jgi:hypothetical protein
LFNWNNIAQQSEKNTMIHFLKNTIKLEWVNQDSNIKQGMDTNIIDIYSTDGKNSVSLILNDDRTTVSLVKSDKTLYEFVTKEEKGGKINVYYKEEISLDSVKAFYRSLKENYEYRHRYNEADKFFIREMELKRKYKQVVSPKDDGFEIKQNNWFRRNLFSFTGLYYHLSRYGQDYLRPALATLSLSILSTLFWGIQRSPSTLHPTFTNTSLHYLTNSTHIEKALERTLASLFQISYNQDFVIIDTFTRAVSLVFVGFLLMQALKRSFRR